MAHEEKIQFHATVENLSEILTWIHERILSAPLSEKQAMHFEIALEEAIVNIVMHAYAKKGGLLEIDAQVTAESLTFTLTDRGIAFDPVSAPLKEEVPTEESTPGGLGVRFMRLYCDALSYSRQDERNILTLEKTRNCLFYSILPHIVTGNFSSTKYDEAF